MSLSSALYSGISFILGFTTLGVFTAFSFIDTRTWQTTSIVSLQRLRKAQHDLWTLSQSTSSTSLEHKFLCLDSGLQLHYLSSFRREPQKSLVIFLHGFPDSANLFRHFLVPSEPHGTATQFVALDLPGFGGSDSLATYSATGVLNAVTEAISELKRRYLEDGASGGRCILVGHDWGGLIAYRVAAETVGLVWRVVTINTAYAPLFKSNAGKMTEECQRALRKLSFRTAWRESGPWLSQLLKSSYIFMFNLPMGLLAKWPFIRRVIDHELRWIWLNGHNANPESPVPSKASNWVQELAISQASCYGPSVDECATHDAEGLSYGPSVLARASCKPPGDWLQRIRLYREGLASRQWVFAEKLKQFEAPSRRNSQRFRCAVTVIFGLQDIALDPRIVLDGISGYFTSSDVLGKTHEMYRTGEVSISRSTSSHVLSLMHCGHWSLLEDTGTNTLEGVLAWAVSGTAEQQKDLSVVLGEKGVVLGRDVTLDVLR
ncbi:hypothetical protein BAUCODRAFT_148789 [Baudoinia panamericana UAMH 10762]|uniref:AB hydrolase-1 domain-containing protein n=1 Tax=Baudoinia panamericana (strain UAMH 10762) TaxID=717646 RepID=M2MWL7_BAUPA|nr:uncharacterized protein BAUCODRAFT_148789 [Baudoinia panamericana UAMH 10762]EMC95938.1 hypothetical protein BAUCODRAFT_148789 [Baudoinia panamericana UAMH 10762]